MYYVLSQFEFFNSQWDYSISLMMTISIYTIGFFTINRPKIFDGELFTSLFLKPMTSNETFNTNTLHEFYNHLIVHMEKEKPYIDNELRLVNLADQLGFSTHLLSKIINEIAGKNFNNFVNEYRLLEAERLLKSEQNYNIKSVYFQVGFNNKVTFYNAFKSKHNCTPSEFKLKSSV